MIVSSPFSFARGSLNRMWFKKQKVCNLWWLSFPRLLFHASSTCLTYCFCPFLAHWHDCLRDRRTETGDGSDRCHGGRWARRFAKVIKMLILIVLDGVLWQECFRCAVLLGALYPRALLPSTFHPGNKGWSLPCCSLTGFAFVQKECLEIELICVCLHIFNKSAELHFCFLAASLPCRWVAKRGSYWCCSHFVVARSFTFTLYRSTMAIAPDGFVKIQLTMMRSGY